MNTELFFSSKSIEWYTPQPFLYGVNKFFETYCRQESLDFKVLDPCSNLLLKSKGLLMEDWENWFWPNKDAKNTSWGPAKRPVFCNPPYGRSLNTYIKTQGAQESFNLWLLPARTDTKWFQSIMQKEHPRNKQKALFVSGRLKFTYPSTEISDREKNAALTISEGTPEGHMQLVDTRTQEFYRMVPYDKIEIVTGSSAGFPSVLIADNMPKTSEELFIETFKHIGVIL